MPLDPEIRIRFESMLCAARYAIDGADLPEEKNEECGFYYRLYMDEMSVDRLRQEIDRLEADLAES